MKALGKLKKYLKACGIDCSDAAGYDLSSEFPVAVAARYDSQEITLFGEQRVVIEPKVEMPSDELIAAY